MRNCRHLNPIGEAESTIFHFNVSLGVRFCLHSSAVRIQNALAKLDNYPKPYHSSGPICYALRWFRHQIFLPDARKFGIAAALRLGRSCLCRNFSV